MMIQLSDSIIRLDSTSLQNIRGFESRTLDSMACCIIIDHLILLDIVDFHSIDDANLEHQRQKG